MHRQKEKNNILITHSYFLQFDAKQRQWHKPYPPLGTIQAAALLRQHGFEVSLFDTMFATEARDISGRLEREKPGILIIYDDGFNYLTKMCLTNMREAAWLMAGEGKKRGCKVIVCSSDSTDHYEKYLKRGVDFVAFGEGEQTVLELVKALTGNASTDDIQGIAFLKEGTIIKNPPRPLMNELDELPLPAWDLIAINPYRESWQKHWGYFSINIATTRGCPYHCNWCAKPIYGNSYKMRSPRHVIREIHMLKQAFNFDHIWFCDDIFGLKRSWVLEFAELVREEKLHFTYKIQSRADLLVKDQYVEALAASGCEEAWMGVESGSQHILDAMEKGITIEQVRLATHLLKSHGIKPCFFIQFGYLNETAADIKKTIELINELLPHDIGISVSYPLPGTKFYEKVKQDLNPKANWTDSDDLELMFANNYSRAFYKSLHRYVHKNFRMHLAKEQMNRTLGHPLSWTAATLKRAFSYFYYAPATFISKKRLKAKHHEASSGL